jgi:TatA/E family protein of Tat protein translocase
MTGILVVLLILLLVFGSSRSLSKAGGGLGSTLRKFKEGLGTKEPPDKDPPA